LHGGNPEPPMSALGQKQTFTYVRPMSALSPKADIAERDWDVRYVPKADIVRCGEIRRYGRIPRLARGPDFQKQVA
jgi:hypothetical protein